ncbi:hypothetical protein TUMEXPCC7403_00215 [Tumidithrix helvetica PCC 7403]|uniref:eCIS core domain-containing protein n=1 Tax=Tumidithrix helvetica TaxID=3457545 RepID=UPI003CBAF49B
MSEYISKPAAQSSFVPPAVQIQTRPFAPPQVQPSAAPQASESSQAERDLENQDKRSSQENLYFTDLSFSGNDDRGSSERVMQRKWEGIVQRYKEGGNAEPDPNHGYTPVRGSSQSIMQRKLDEMRQRVKEGGNVAPDPNYGYTPVRGSSESIMQRKHQEMVQRYRENQAKTIQAKLAIGAVGDKYEQEADRVAAEVVQKINVPESVQREEVPEEEEKLQMKPAISSIQREAMPEEEEDLQMKPVISSIQREPEEEEDLQMMPAISSIQREAMLEEEEELQAKSLVQRRDTLAGVEASADLESSIQNARGSGQSLEPNLQAKMGEAMGADFSGVKVHTDSQSDRLNQSIQARAFTTGQDVFFRQGAYDPSSRGGQELIAHELTHVVQQNGNVIQKKPTTTPLVRTTAKTKANIQRDGDEATSKPAEEPASKVEELHQGVGKKFMFKLYEEASVAKVEFDPIVSNIASITNGTAKIPKLKDQNTAVAKSEGEYGGDHSRLVDICRASIIYNSYRDLMLGLGKCKEMLALVREKNRFAKPTPAGYRDILLNVRLSNGHIAELQLHLQQIMDVKNGVGHKLYEEVRSIERAAKEAGKALDPEETAKVEQLLQESRSHYDAALDKAQSSDETPST